MFVKPGFSKTKNHKKYILFKLFLHVLFLIADYNLNKSLSVFKCLSLSSNFKCIFKSHLLHASIMFHVLFMSNYYKLNLCPGQKSTGCLSSLSPLLDTSVFLYLKDYNWFGLDCGVGMVCKIMFQLNLTFKCYFCGVCVFSTHSHWKTQVCCDFVWIRTIWFKQKRTILKIISGGLNWSY